MKNKEYRLIIKEVNRLKQIVKNIEQLLGKQNQVVKNQDTTPTCRQFVQDYLQKNGPQTAADLWHFGNKKYGGWSRHSLYRILHDAQQFRFINGKYELVKYVKLTDKKHAIVKEAAA